MLQLDEELIYRTRRRGRVLTPADRIALNLFKRRGVRVVVLARAFGVSKNTVYYKAITGEAPSYPQGDAAADTNALIDKIGADVAWEKYVTNAMIAAVNRENAIEADSRVQEQGKRRRRSAPR
jgi:predicted DNA binding protein